MEMQQLIERINALARKAKSEALTEAELQERDALRRAYIDAVKASLISQLDNTYVLEPDGTKRKLTPKK